LPAVFAVDARSGVPIYLQLVEQIKRAVALPSLEPGEQLPTVKALALALTVNPNTVPRVSRARTRPGHRDEPKPRLVRPREGRAEAKRVVGDVAAIGIDHAVREARALGLVPTSRSYGRSPQSHSSTPRRRGSALRFK